MNRGLAEAGQVVVRHETVPGVRSRQAPLPHRLGQVVGSASTLPEKTRTVARLCRLVERYCPGSAPGRPR